MKNELVVKVKEMFGEVRIIDKDDNPWFVAKDVCDRLGLKARDSVRYLKDPYKSFVSRQSLGLKPGKAMCLMSEPGLYKLIFNSRKPEAEKFKDWVCDEVLPSIRKSGGYLSPEIDWTDIDSIQRVLDAQKQAELL